MNSENKVSPLSSTPDAEDDAKSDFSFDLDRHSSVKYYKKEQPEQKQAAASAGAPTDYLEFSDSSYEFDEDLVYEQYYENEDERADPRSAQCSAHNPHSPAAGAPQAPPAAALAPPAQPLRTKSLGVERKISRPRVQRSQSLVVHRGDRVITYFGACKEALAPIQESDDL